MLHCVCLGTPRNTERGLSLLTHGRLPQFLPTYRARWYCEGWVLSHHFWVPCRSVATPGSLGAQGNGEGFAGTGARRAGAFPSSALSHEVPLSMAEYVFLCFFCSGGGFAVERSARLLHRQSKASAPFSPPFSFSFLLGGGFWWRSPYSATCPSSIVAALPLLAARYRRSVYFVFFSFFGPSGEGGSHGSAGQRPLRPLTRLTPLL